jgi:leucyl-tRNA synthetase
MMYPLIPHVAEELWESFGKKSMLADVSWPDYIEELTVRNEVEIVFQINGKIKAKCMVPSEITAPEMEKMAFETDKIAEAVNDKNVKKVIVVPGKLVNIVVV